jgi:hypothetical protein
LILAAMASLLWSAGWVVLTLAGAGPRGGLWSAAERIGAALWGLLRDRGQAGWVQVVWNPAHTPALPLVLLTTGGLVLVGAALVRTARYLLWKVPGWVKFSRSGATAGTSTGASAGTGQSLDQWLAQVEAEGDE